MLRAGKSINPRFLYHLIFSEIVAKQLRQQEVGSNYPAVNETDVQALRIPLPSSISEQQKIAEILDTVEKAIALTQTHVNKLKLAKAGLLHDLLTKGIDEHGELRNPNHNPEQFKDSPLGKIPKDWIIKPLTELAEINSGVTLGRKLNGFGTVELPYLRVANVQDGYLDLSEIKTVRIFKQEIPRYLLQSGDVLMNEGGDYDKLGRGTVWYGQVSPCLHQNHVFRVRPNQDKLTSKFLALISSSSYGKKFFILSSK